MADGVLIITVKNELAETETTATTIH